MHFVKKQGAHQKQDREMADKLVFLDSDFVLLHNETDLGSKGMQSIDFFTTNVSTCSCFFSHTGLLLS